MFEAKTTETRPEIEAELKLKMDNYCFQWPFTEFDQNIKRYDFTKQRKPGPGGSKHSASRWLEVSKPYVSV